jgi:hypothetical protein
MFYFFPDNYGVYEIMRKNIVELERPQVIILRMRIACSKPKASTTHSEYVIHFHCNNGYTNTPHCYVIRTLPLLLVLSEYLPREIVENHGYQERTADKPTKK